MWLCEGIIGEGRSLLVFTFVFEGDDDDDDNEDEDEDDDDDDNDDSNSNSKVFFFFLFHKGQFCCGHGGLVIFIIFIFFNYLIMNT